MHAPRRCRRMRGPLTVVALVLMTLAAAFVVRQSLACPIEVPPQPLRTLYRTSARVVVARVGATEVTEREESVSHVRTALHVERSLKGKDEGPVVFVRHVTWVEDGVEKPGTFERDERLLVFLKRAEEGDDYEVDDANYGVKKLTDDELKVYVARIGELESVEARLPADKTALVEWLVRCAEEPATRWEGAYELMLSADALARGAEPTEAPSVVAAVPYVDKHTATVEEYAAYEAAVERARTTPAPVAVQVAEQLRVEPEPIDVRRITPRDPSLVTSLGEDQKRRLADALFAAEKIGEGEHALVTVVKDFGDARFIPFIIAQLRRVEDDPPPEAVEWLAALAQVMKNEEANELVMKFSEQVTYFEEEVSDEGAEEADAVDEQAAQKELEEREAAGYQRAREKRSAMLKDLLVRVEVILASPPQVARSQTDN